MDFSNLFKDLDRSYSRESFVAAIDVAVQSVEHIHRKVAEWTKEADGEKPNYTRILGGLGQLWRSPELEKYGLQMHPSSLGQMLVLGGVGALGGNLAGRFVDWVAPSDTHKASRVGTMIGALAGASPGLASAYLNPFMGKSILFDSYYDSPKQAGSPELTEKIGSTFMEGYQPINVADFQTTLWRDPRMQTLPLQVQAGASGLVQLASTLPGGGGGTGFVTPFDIARVAVGMGSGLASGWLVGKTMGALFGTGQKTQDLLKNTGMAVGALKAVVPVAFGHEPFAFGG